MVSGAIGGKTTKTSVLPGFSKIARRSFIMVLPNLSGTTVGHVYTIKIRKLFEESKTVGANDFGHPLKE